MKRQTKLITAFAAATLAFAISASAATVVPVTAYGHNNKDNFGGNISDISNGSGMNGYNWQGGDANDHVAAPVDWPNAEGAPSTWTSTGGQYRDEWQAAGVLDVSTSIDGKIGWVIMDLGAEYDVDNMYLWNGLQIGTNALKDYRVHHSTVPIVPGTQGPTGNTGVDYDFGVAAWTQLGGTHTLTTGAGSANGVVAFGGVTARYVALEMLTKQNGDTTVDSKTGFAEAAFTTVVPEPSSAALLGLGGLALIFRRRK